jgi:hypothetical protein
MNRTGALDFTIEALPKHTLSFTPGFNQVIRVPLSFSPGFSQVIRAF